MAFPETAMTYEDVLRFNDEWKVAHPITSQYKVWCAFCEAIVKPNVYVVFQVPEWRVLGELYLCEYHFEEGKPSYDDIYGGNYTYQKV